jgi:putative addiction module killer protein
MLEIFRSETFDGWLRELRDIRARARIEARILRLSHGNPGDVKFLGSGVSEMRIDYGPGYRVYFTRRGRSLLCFCAAAISARRTPISSGRSRLLKIGKTE